MLTSDLVRTRVRAGELQLVPLEKAARQRAELMAEQLLAAADAHVGQPRESLIAAFSAVESGPRDRRLKDGLRKLVEDGCEFDAEPPIDPEVLRAEVFLLASSQRRTDVADSEFGAPTFDRARVIEAVATAHDLSPSALEEALYADLRGAQKLQRARAISPAGLVDEYQLGQAQAILLRAVRVEVDFSFRSPASYRALFRKLKFLRLLYTLSPGEDGAYHLSIDGPYSLFESVTRYGLSLALLLPTLRSCDQFRLRADIRWGPERVPLVFRLEHDAAPTRARTKDRPSAAELPDEVAKLLSALDGSDSPWRAQLASALFDLPGVGLCVPDLTFVHGKTGAEVHLEVLGHWSRQAVWKRVELVERGLKDRVLFAVSEHLRVSEEALDGAQSSALYVYKRALHPKTILEKIDALGRV